MSEILMDPDHVDDVVKALESIISELIEKLEFVADCDEESTESIIESHNRFRQMLKDMSEGYEVQKMSPDEITEQVEKGRDLHVQEIGKLQNKIDQMRLLLDLVKKSNCTEEQLWLVHNVIRNTLVYKMSEAVIMRKFSSSNLMRIQYYVEGLMPFIHCNDELTSPLED